MNDGGPAFPIPDESVAHWGVMSLRDWFAGQALLGLGKAYAEGSIDDFTPPQLAWTAYQLADAMIAEREKHEND